MQVTDEEWKKKLTPEQYAVLRQKGTEIPFTGELLHTNDTGKYVCAACGSVVFTSEGKYDTHTPGLDGWPSFSDVANSEAVDLKNDDSFGMRRIEVVCKNCGGHLGHLFDDPTSPSGQHYCVNSCALNFMPQNKAHETKP